MSDCPQVSTNQQSIAGISSTGNLLIWSRNRQHLEWWGLYERAQMWFACGLLIALIWSFVRDFSGRRA